MVILRVQIYHQIFYQVRVVLEMLMKRKKMIHKFIMNILRHLKLNYLLNNQMIKHNLGKIKSWKRTCCEHAKLPIRLVADYEYNAVVELFMTNNGYLFIHILTFDFGFMVSIATTWAEVETLNFARLCLVQKTGIS